MTTEVLNTAENFNIEFMRKAILLAKEAFQNHEVPVGAVIVKDFKVIGVGMNNVISSSSVIGHAEINAIFNAGQAIQNYRLNGCDLYVSLEPCHMCAKAIVDARINNLFFGALEPKTGSIVSIDNFLDSEHLNHKVNYSYGYMQSESIDLLKSFFQSKRLA